MNTHANCELTSQVQDDILGRRPSTQFTCELNTQNLRCLELPRRVNQSIDSIGTTDTNDDRAQTTSIDGMAVGTKHHKSRLEAVSILILHSIT